LSEKRPSCLATRLENANTLVWGRLYYSRPCTVHVVGTNCVKLEEADLTTSDLSTSAFEVANGVWTAGSWLETKMKWSRSPVTTQFDKDTSIPKWTEATITVPQGTFTFDKIRLPTSLLQQPDDSRTSALFHEYGHAVHYALRGNNLLSDPMAPDNHTISTEVTPWFALVEGWADFFKSAVLDNPILHGWVLVPDPCPGLILNLDQNNFWFGREGRPCWDGLSGVNGNGNTGEIVEGAVASIFWDIFDAPQSDDDGIPGEFHKLWQIFSDAGANLNTIEDFRGKWGADPRLDRIYVDHGVPAMDDTYDAGQGNDFPGVAAPIQIAVPDHAGQGKQELRELDGIMAESDNIPFENIDGTPVSDHRVKEGAGDWYALTFVPEKPGASYVVDVSLDYDPQFGYLDLCVPESGTYVFNSYPFSAFQFTLDGSQEQYVMKMGVTGRGVTLGTNRTYPGEPFTGFGDYHPGYKLTIAATEVPSVQFAQSSQVVSEAAGTVTVAVELSEATNTAVVVPLILSGSATEGAAADYTTTSAAIGIEPGTTSATISFVLNDDAREEPNETIVVAMGAPVNAVAGARTVHIISIIDEDGGGGAGFLDFGDAPDPSYATLLASDGARHLLGSGLFLGSLVDRESDARAHADALGDDQSGVDDEDGVLFRSPLTPGSEAMVDVTATAPGFLNAWIDWNDDGDWCDQDEHVLTDVPLVAGANSLTLAVPASAVATSETFARFRFSSVMELSFGGPSSDGEVED